MKEWRIYSTEYGDSWVILKDAKSLELPEDLTSKKGESAITAMKRKPGNIVSCSILSGSREIDSVTGRLGYEKDFYIQIFCMKDDWSVILLGYYYLVHIGLLIR